MLWQLPQLGAELLTGLVLLWAARCSLCCKQNEGPEGRSGPTTVFIGFPTMEQILLTEMIMLLFHQLEIRLQKFPKSWMEVESKLLLYYFGFSVFCAGFIGLSYISQPKRVFLLRECNIC